MLRLIMDGENKKMKLAAEDIIENAIEKLRPINYESFDTGYFVLQNGRDMGNSDYCINCIGEAVKEARKNHREGREKIKAKYNLIETSGYCLHNGKRVRVKGKYTEEQIADSKRGELKKYPAKATFTHEGHDPDFGGGLHEPCGCSDCGEYFTCNFEPDRNEAEHLLHLVNRPGPLTDRNKWEIEIALGNYRYVKDDVKRLLEQVAEKIIQSQ